MRISQQILGEQAISLNAYDQMTKQFDWDILRKNVDKIVNAVPAFIRSHGLQGADVKATQDYIRSLIMNGAQAGGLTDLVPKPDTFDWNAAKSARPSGAGAISGDFGSPESILGKLARALFPNSNAQTSGSGLSGQRQITDYKYRKTRAGGYALVNKKTGAVASSDDVQWYLAHGGRKP
jgi:hypothetical protein